MVLALRTHVLGLLGPKTILYGALGLIFSLGVMVLGRYLIFRYLNP